MALRRGHLECGANCWPDAVTSSQHVYEVRPRKDQRGVDLISDVEDREKAVARCVRFLAPGNAPIPCAPCSRRSEHCASRPTARE